MRLAALFLLTTAAQAEPPSAVRIENSEEAGTCTAAPLAPDLIVTAAHCLAPGREGYRAQPTAGAAQGIVRVHPHPVFALAPPGPVRFRFDVALAELAAPLGSAPLPVGPPPVPGERLAIETWRRGEPAPQRRGCAVLAAPAGAVVLDCAVGTGHSGAPVLRETGEGAEIVAVLVATLTFEGRPAALGVALQDRLEVLLQAAGRD
ncbi:trypsin-like serine peptidase [Jannaschia formosa]|uniref:trypsin-like serine peptidase n=1 Tax=Jannaschia formosa TaxID=2259592 RepID=UPI00143108A5|nr:trypsin-like peptidase domain-containing protein [Jannaschia formosa]